jgi:hypothetical protein
MAQTPDFKDIVTRWTDHPKYKGTNYLIENDLVEVVVQKLEMILFTNKGSVLGDDDMGGNLEYYLWKTSVPNNTLKSIITDQIIVYIPELYSLGYTLDLNIYEGTVQDILSLDFVINGYNVNFIFS